jgi:hypothetical protein
MRSVIKGPIAFEKAMHGIYTRAKAEAGYNATIYLRMLDERGGLGTAKYLINAATVSDGYTALWQLQRLDLTVEALVIDNPQWHSLFEPSEIERARKRLGEYGYTPAS